jgi:V8-like Glu-specific endopeptidase
MFTLRQALSSSYRRSYGRADTESIRTWAVVLALLLAMAAFGLPAAAADLNEVVWEEVDSSREDAEAFWTEERLREAQPMPMPTPGEDAEASALATKGLQVFSGATVVPGALPGQKVGFLGPYDPSVGNTLAPRWGTAPWVYSRYRLFPDGVSTYTTYPYSTVGKLFFQIPGVGLFVCSASVVTGQNSSTVLTAGHCVYSPPPGTFGYVGTHTNFVFIPSRRTGANPVGTWTAAVSATTVGWQFGFLEYDVGALVMNRGGLGNNHVAAVTGSLGVLFNGPQVQHYHGLGYPQAPRNLSQTQPGAQFDGEHQEICTSATAGIDLPTGGAGDPPTIGIGCDSTGGTSGGPWVVNFSGFLAKANNLINSVFSYRYTGPNPPANLRSYGPYFGPAAQNLWSFASAFPIP